MVTCIGAQNARRYTSDILLAKAWIVPCCWVMAVASAVSLVRLFVLLVPAALFLSSAKGLKALFELGALMVMIFCGDGDGVVHCCGVDVSWLNLRCRYPSLLVVSWEVPRKSRGGVHSLGTHHGVHQRTRS